jgi:hypothetical protein
MRRVLLPGRRTGPRTIAAGPAPGGDRDSHKRHRSAFNLPRGRGAIRAGEPIGIPYGPDDDMLESCRCSAANARDATAPHAAPIVSPRMENRRSG